MSANQDHPQRHFNELVSHEAKMMGRPLTLEERMELSKTATGAGARLADDWDAVLLAAYEGLPAIVRSWLDAVGLTPE